MLLPRGSPLSWLVVASLAWTAVWIGKGAAQEPARGPQAACAGSSPGHGHVGGTGGPGTQVAGKVVDAASRDPVTGVLVRLEPGRDLRAVTDDEGRFLMPELVPGTYRLSLGGVGYARQSTCVALPPDRELDLVVAIRPRPIPLEPLAVSVEGARPLWLVREGFYRRMEEGGGVFITAEDIREQAPSRVSEMFRGRASVAVASGNPEPMQRLRSAHPPPGVPGRRRPQDTGPCPIQFLVDGRRTPLILGVDAFHPEDVAAIEAYFNASQIPPRFNVGNAACGVVNIWLKVHADRRE